MEKSLRDMTPAELNDWYERKVGYRPQIDCPSMTDADLLDLCQSYAAEEARHAS